MSIQKHHALYCFQRQLKTSHISQQHQQHAEQFSTSSTQVCSVYCVINLTHCCILSVVTHCCLNTVSLCPQQQLCETRATHLHFPLTYCATDHASYTLLHHVGCHAVRSLFMHTGSNTIVKLRPGSDISSSSWHGVGSRQVQVEDCIMLLGQATSQTQVRYAQRLCGYGTQRACTDSQRSGGVFPTQ